MIKLGELDFKTRLKIAWSLKNNEKSINYISIKYDINRKAVENIGLLYNQYGEPGLRDTSITSRPKPSDIEPSVQEMIVTIVLHHIHLTTNEVRNLLSEEGKKIDPAPIQRFLTQAGLGSEELRSQYLVELRGVGNSRATRGIQKFAYDKFGALDGRDKNKQLIDSDKHHYLLLNKLSLNPKIEPSNKTAALYLFLNLCSHRVEIMVNDREFVSFKRKEFMDKLNSYFSLNNRALFNELYLCFDSFQAFTDQVINVYIDKSSDHLDDLNNSFIKWFGNQRLVVGEANNFFDRKIDFKVNFRAKLRATIMNSRTYNSNQGNNDQIALDYSLDRIQQFVIDHNAALVKEFQHSSRPEYPASEQNAQLQEKPIMKYSELLDEWVVRNMDLASRLQGMPKATVAQMMKDWRRRNDN